ncbi:hypothetical protein I7I50_06140 [Histoplasma capsulatum G186AR]|uniref:Uncharacterized protein n=1 Tax=Ajellomyces capsulatus TaxID=5037 RepID=A0A8H7Z319_AJECA|nr:hypothetical protein I7I52_10782 [Histoplasma capsulatum]QSS67145.1 hypothetical protein I7I50_06140 [Histoplasma capsulatum G186AR]
MLLSLLLSDSIFLSLSQPIQSGHILSEWWHFYKQSILVGQSSALIYTQEPQMCPRPYNH